MRFILFLMAISFVTTVFGDSATDFMNSGVLKGQKGNYIDALDDFNKAIELSPAFAEAYNERGIAEGRLAKNGDDTDRFLAKALADYNTAIKLKPNFAAAYYNRGNVMQAKGDWESAKANFNVVVQTKPKPNYVLLAQAFLHLGRLADREGNQKEARLNYSQAYFNYGLSKQQRRDFDGALVDYSKTIELDPDFFNYYVCRGTVKEEKGDRTGAIGDYDKAIELNPNFALSYYNRGHAKFNNGDLDGALADYSKSIELYPTNADAFLNRGLLKHTMGDMAGSLADFNKAIELNPEKRDFLKAKGYLVGDINTEKQ